MSKVALVGVLVLVGVNVDVNVDVDELQLEDGQHDESTYADSGHGNTMTQRLTLTKNCAAQFVRAHILVG
eukprot:5075952-Amphidinium_carterae.1